MKRAILFAVFTASLATPLFSQIDKLNPIFFTVMNRRFEDGSVDNKINRLITPTAPATNIRILFIKELMREAVAAGNPDSVQNRMRVITSYIGVLEKERDDNLGRQAGKADSQKILEKYAESMKSAYTELTEIQGRLATVTIGIKGTVILHNGKQYPLEIPGYSQATDSDSGRCQQSRTRSYFINTKGDITDDVADVEINLTGENLSEGDQVRLVVENTGKNSTRQLINYFRIEPVGWNLEVRPCLVFIKRAHEKNSAFNKSNFKPAPALSLQYSHFAGSTRNENLWKNFSVGIHTAFVDYDVSQTIEVGVGLIAYGFNSSIGVGYGWNIGAHSKKGYYLIGVDLLRFLRTMKNIYTGRDG